jgi:glutathione synthase/RimK-type ligase-like ATP-grasp enzyme
MERIAIATCSELPVADDDQVLLADACGDLGIEAVPAVWDDEGVDWDSFPLVVLRSTWDYTDRLDRFLAWVGSLRRVCNPLEVVAWNTDKRYLEDLGHRGVSVTPTTYARRGSDLVVPDAERFVVKPSIGAGSMGAERFERSERDRAAAHIDRLAEAGKVSMVQPYLDGVDSLGETSVILIDGVPSHAIEKGAMLVVDELDRTGLYRTESIRHRSASDEELVVARRALDAALEVTGQDAPLLYARVDLLPGEDGPVVVELELTEPSLFLTFGEGSASRFATAIATRI